MAGRYWIGLHKKSVFGIVQVIDIVIPSDFSKAVLDCD